MKCFPFLVFAVLTAFPPRAFSGTEEVRPEVTVEALAFGSCARETLDQPVWDGVAAVKPDAFVLLGDNIYGDTEDMDVLRAKYAAFGAKPGFARLREHVPLLATWDDHDYGQNDGGASYPMKAESKDVFLEFFKVPADSPRRQHAGIYGATVLGPPGKRVQVILLDTRTFRSPLVGDRRTAGEKKRLNLVGWYVPTKNESTTLLGAEQWAWLETQLREPAELRVIASSIQVIASEKGMESWGNFPHERERLYQIIRATGARRTILLSGDVHFSEVSRTGAPEWPLYDFTSSGLTNSSAEWAAAVNTFRVSPQAYAKPTFGVVRVGWSGTGPAVKLEACDVTGQPVFSVPVEWPPEK